MNKKILTVLITIFMGAALSAQYIHMVIAATGDEDEFPTEGYYAASNTFSRNSLVELKDPEDGKSIHVIIAKRLNSSGNVIVLSQQAADFFGINRQNPVSLLASLISIPDVTNISPGSDRPYSIDPEINPGAAFDDPHVFTFSSDISDVPDITLTPTDPPTADPLSAELPAPIPPAPVSAPAPAEASTPISATIVDAGVEPPNAPSAQEPLGNRAFPLPETAGQEEIVDVGVEPPNAPPTPEPLGNRAFPLPETAGQEKIDAGIEPPDAPPTPEPFRNRAFPIPETAAQEKIDAGIEPPNAPPLREIDRSSFAIAHIEEPIPEREKPTEREKPMEDEIIVSPEATDTDPIDETDPVEQEKIEASIPLPDAPPAQEVDPSSFTIAQSTSLIDTEDIEEPLPEFERPMEDEIIVSLEAAEFRSPPADPVEDLTIDSSHLLTSLEETPEKIAAVPENLPKNLPKTDGEPEPIDPLPVEEPPQTAAADSMPDMEWAENNLPLVYTLQSNKYYLQVGAFTNPRGAKDFLETVSPGYPLIVLPITQGENKLYGVLVGPLSNDEKGIALYWFKTRGYQDAFLREGA